MTREIFFNIASLEHMTKQRLGKRYALFCMDTREGTAEFECETNSKMGHIGDFESYQDAKDIGISHPHSVYIRFYPDGFNSHPTQDFVEDRNAAPADHVID
ncbi:hypothetical protein A3A54_02415 [Candidatus Curtissbacteria bacterium RIFCSPLOWO2_01_FULL_39_62]|uniref:Uncharacterized protein n=1 Tax=Candidatus Curtissbacteria bacterium RIFCSPHIGHO2_02_FULL_40_16b TaxID=1797714 RepID=A0A1F5G6R0_9BACT|nr:MAG: hypothetical protein A3D04_04785 [Candidatus Curtissbacteria bacterium RIFCSPHIGHO2_02_FULL_40_16b]OGE00764.1 MAG: hypothetical protein A3A54_02415 [Candidatus Curtissbacteria bacterium RIFCSPLOWO2_01_FULL_39_62]